MKRYAEQLLVLLLITAPVISSYAASQSEEEDLALAYGDKSFVTIASGSRQPIARAPSVATVITAEDIEAIGAVDIDEVLETVPSLHVSRSPIGYNPIYTIRGISTQYNPQVLMLVNGIPITGAYVGDRSIVWGGMPVENIARIEVIRGPGSALYGADAFAGVINIITKTASDIHGTQLGLRAGSFNSRDAWVQHGGTWGGFDAAAYLSVGHTDGQHQIIASDAQSFLDSLNGTNASLAPGPVNLGRDTIDGRIDLAREKWQLRASYQERDNVGAGAGIASALDPTGKNYGQRISTDLTYHDESFIPNLDVIAQASYLHITEKSDLTLFPAGSNYFGLGSFPNGVIGNPYKWERHLRFNISAAYTGLQNHKLRFGTGIQSDDLYRIQETRNYSLTLVPGVGYFPAPLGTVVDVTDTAPFIRPHDRRVSYAYAQDEWSFIKDWYLTAGVRQDHYSDFGNTVNPRAALVWETAYNLTSKLLYGRAFRPPSFVELYNINNPVALGNPDLKPESNESVELAFAWQVASNLQANLNLFRYQMKDVLHFVQDTSTGISTAQNAGKQHGQGMEVELIWDANQNLRLSGNYAQQHSIDEATNMDPGNAPRHHVYARADWRFMPRWALDTQLNYVADRKREPSDTRPPIADYHTVDLTLRTNNQNNDWGVACKVLNLFNADAREPSPSPGLIPNDLPLAPREWRFELSHQL